MQNAPSFFDGGWEALKRWLPLAALEDKVEAARRELSLFNILVADDLRSRSPLPWRVCYPQEPGLANQPERLQH